MENKKVHEPLKPAAKKLPEMRDAMQRHHDRFLSLPPEEINEENRVQIELALQREADGDVKPLAPAEPQA